MWTPAYLHVCSPCPQVIQGWCKWSQMAWTIRGKQNPELRGTKSFMMSSNRLPFVLERDTVSSKMVSKAALGPGKRCHFSIGRLFYKHTCTDSLEQWAISSLLCEMSRNMRGPWRIIPQKNCLLFQDFLFVFCFVCVFCCLFLLCVLWAPWIWGLGSVIDFVTLLAIISSRTTSVLCFLSLLLGFQWHIY